MIPLAERSFGSNATSPSPLHLARDRTASRNVTDRTFWDILAAYNHRALRVRLSRRVESNTGTIDEPDELGGGHDAAFSAALLCFLETLASTQDANTQSGIGFHGQRASTTSASARVVNPSDFPTAAAHADFPCFLLARTAHGHFEHLFSRFFTEHRDIALEALKDGPEALDQEIIHWIADTGVCGTEINEFWSAFNDPVCSALTCYINLRTRGQQ
jgi:hypothetical protein